MSVANWNQLTYNEVSKSFRRCGIDRKMLSCLSEYLSSNDVKELCVYPCATDPESVPQEQLLQIYKALGFHENPDNNAQYIYKIRT